MVAINHSWRGSSAVANPVPPAGVLAERVRHYFARHPEVSREEFLLEALGRELTLRDGAGAAGPRLTEEDIRIHARLNERLAALHYERHGLWPRIRRFLFGNRSAR